MTAISLTVPKVGEKNSEADPQTQAAFEELVAFLNGANLDATNIKAEGITEALLASAVKTALAERAGLVSVKSIVATEQSRSNPAFGVLATPDEVTVVLPTNGLIVVGFQGAWAETVAVSTTEAAIFLNGNELLVAGALTAVGSSAYISTDAHPGNFVPLFSTSYGLDTLEPAVSSYSGDVTTGQLIGGVSASKHAGSTMSIFAAAGTYKISVRYKSGSTVTVKNRKLWAWIVA